MTALRFSGGPIHTMDPRRPVAGELLVQGGVVVERTSARPREVDLRGRCLLPGFSDAHVHFPSWAAARRQVRLEGARTIGEALDRVAAAARALDGTPGSRWLRGIGWRAGDWDPPVEPDRALLDRAAPGVAVTLTSRDYHSLWLSSVALERAGGDLAVPGGVVEVDAAGEPTGVLREQAAWTFRDRWCAPTADEYLDAMREGVAVANARGVVAVHDKDGWIGALELFERLRDAGALTLRVWQSVPHEQLDAFADHPSRAAASLPEAGVRLGYVKAFMDGTLGSDTALLSERTAAAGAPRGIEITTRGAFEDVVRRAAAVNLPVAVHAIGDLANRNALDAFEATRDVWAPRGLRQRIEHAQLLDDADVGRFAALGVTASVQFSHAPSDRDLADAAWGPAAARAYPYGALLRAGARLVNGSDAPVEELDPLRGIAAGVRRTLDQRPPWQPQNAVTVEQALRASTAEPAWLACDEHRRGRLVPGLLADAVVLDRDPMTCPAEELAEIEVVATLVGGRWVHGADTMHE